MDILKKENAEKGKENAEMKEESKESKEESKQTQEPKSELQQEKIELMEEDGETQAKTKIQSSSLPVIEGDSPVLSLNASEKGEESVKSLETQQ